jgi:hypothetical protein
MPTQREIAVPLANYPSGSRTVTARNVPDWATHFAFEFNRCSSLDASLWPNASTTLLIHFEVRVGVDWLDAGGFASAGGIVFDPDGEAEALKSIGRINLPPGANRQLRADVTIANGPLRTAGHLEFTG